MKELFLENHTITQGLREKTNNQKAFVLWLTGLSASGKSTLANAVEKELYEQGKKTYLLDGDNLRDTLNNDLGFSDKDREENIRRVAHLSHILVDAGLIVISAFISPFEKDRLFAKSLLQKNEFVEVFVNTPIDVCERRDTKGLYKKAKTGELKNFTGVSSSYETPKNPDIVIENSSLEENVSLILKFLEKRYK
jgi:adenylylsulfate kinase